MDAIECIRERRSIRKFKPETVPKELLSEIIGIAQWSPSYKNSQPWECIVLSGAKKEALTKAMVQLLENGVKPSPDLPEPMTWPPAETAKIDHHMKRRVQLTGRHMDDPQARKMIKKANFGFYGAPHAIYLYQDASLTPWSLFDMGLFAQTMMLAARAKGFGTVPQAFATDYAEEIKKFLGLPETKRIIICISIGYPDMEAPENAYRSDRAGMDQFVKWIDG